MSAPIPEFIPQPSQAAFSSTATEFGPDHTTADHAAPFENLKPPKIPPKPRNGQAPRSNGSVFGKLGSNKKLRSPVRKLTDEDIEKIESLYTFGAMGLMSFRPKAAQVMAQSAESCALAWAKLANENDSVRRALLVAIEGGVWGALFTAHMPIFYALLPDKAIPAWLRPDEPSES
jgi:hypothetical protein